MKKIEKLHIIKNMYPEAKIELYYNTPFQLLMSVMLSAQTTDIMVNRATKDLYKKYKSAEDYKNLNFDFLYSYLKIVGFATTKTKNLLKTAKIIAEDYKGIIPDKREILVTLPGVGQKTANVVLSNLYGQNYIAVDTHIERICKRLAISKESSTVLKVEEDLVRILKGEDLNQYHHSLIFFGRYHCKAKKPDCLECPLQKDCRYFKQIKKNTK